MIAMHRTYQLLNEMISEMVVRLDVWLTCMFVKSVNIVRSKMLTMMTSGSNNHARIMTMALFLRIVLCCIIVAGVCVVITCTPSCDPHIVTR